MSGSENLYGLDEIKTYFSSLCREKKLSHAYLIEGAHGTGKKSLVRFIASELGCKTENIDTCPDIRFIFRENDKKNISIDAVRGVISDAYLTPSVLDFKLYAFDGAETLSPQAQNALLKVIEEPPENVYFFLLCESCAQILTTVKSRTKKIVMPTFSVNEITELLASENFSASRDRCGIAAKLSGGSVGYARELYENDDTATFFGIAKKIIQAQSEKNVKVKYFDFLSIFTDEIKAKQDIPSLASYLFMCYRELLLSKLTGEDQNVLFSPEETKKYISSLSLGGINESVNSLNIIMSDSAYNFNATLAATSLAVLLWRAL